VPARYSIGLFSLGEESESAFGGASLAPIQGWENRETWDMGCRALHEARTLTVPYARDLIHLV
jgi:hypothetical protein